MKKKQTHKTKEDDRYKKIASWSLIPVCFSFIGELTHTKIWNKLT